MSELQGMSRTRLRKQVCFKDSESKTKQNFKKECDVNYIVDRYCKGLASKITLNPQTGKYGDFITSEDYHSSMNKIVEAQMAFEELPSELRKKFANDPQQFLEFVENPENISEMVELGLAVNTKPAESNPIAPSVTNPEIVEPEGSDS